MAFFIRTMISYSPPSLANADAIIAALDNHLDDWFPVNRRLSGRRLSCRRQLTDRRVGWKVCFQSIDESAVDDPDPPRPGSPPAYKEFLVAHNRPSLRL